MPKYHYEKPMGQNSTHLKIFMPRYHYELTETNRCVKILLCPLLCARGWTRERGRRSRTSSSSSVGTGARSPPPMKSPRKRRVPLLCIVRRSRTTELTAARPHLNLATCSARHLRAPFATTPAALPQPCWPLCLATSATSKRRQHRAATWRSGSS